MQLSLTLIPGTLLVDHRVEPRLPPARLPNDVAVTSVQTYLPPNKDMTKFIRILTIRTDTWYQAKSNANKYEGKGSCDDSKIPLLKLTASKQPKTPAARTGREALDRRRSRLSKNQESTFYNTITSTEICFIRNNIKIQIFWHLRNDWIQKK